MPEKTRCSFCEQLPTISRPGRGQPSKCPLCKQELWVSPDGVTQRVVEGDAPARTAPRFVLAGLGMGLLVCLISGAALTRQAWRPAEIDPGPAPAPAVLAPTLIASAPPREVAPGLPVAQAKGAIPDAAARVKPAKSMERLAKSAAKPADRVIDYPPVAKNATAPFPAAWQWAHVYSEKEVQAFLAAVPEVDLDPKYKTKSGKDLLAFAKDIRQENSRDRDGFILKLKKDRDDLAGLPFLLGKDCGLSSQSATALREGSLAVRRRLAEVDGLLRLSRARSNLPAEGASSADAFWHEFTIDADWAPAVHQILSAQDSTHRESLAENMARLESPKASESLAKLALYDPNPEVRGRALKGLAERPKGEYLHEFARALRHPWPQIARNASFAAAVLKLNELIPDLVASLNEPDPSAPFIVKTDDGKRKKMIREMVRINHHRNCMLCHAPADGATPTRSVPVGPAVSMQDPLPPMNSVAYYSERRGGILVRADVTYLRQDFSVMQEVKDPGKWPAQQRFDFFVRTRELGINEPYAVNNGASPHRQAVLDALFVLTGKSGPPEAAAWKDEVAKAPRISKN